MGGRRHAFNVGLNITGMVLPLAGGVFTIPGLLDRLGPEKFGVLALGWALVGYFGFLDLGMGRALTQYLASAEKAGTPRQEQATVAHAARSLLGGLSVGLALVLWLLLPWLAGFVKMSADLHEQALAAIPLLMLAVPLVMWFSCSTGVLEARSRFAAVSSVRIPTGLGNFLAPWLVSLFTVDLFWVIGSLLAVRLAGALGMAWWARTEFSHSAAPWPKEGIKKLLRFGGWMTVSNLVGPLMSYFDRFAIAAWVSAAAVTHYTVPFDVIWRFPMAPMAVMGVLLPLFAHSNPTSAEVTDHRSRITHTVALLLVCWIPGMLVASWAGPWFLERWVGEQMALASAPIWRWLAVGVLVNGLAHLPFTMLQGAGRTDVIARIHILELLPYMAGLWWALSHYGVVGAAVVWSLRVSIDAALLYLQGYRLFRAWRRFFIRVVLCGLVGASIALSLAL